MKELIRFAACALGLALMSGAAARAQDAASPTGAASTEPSIAVALADYNALPMGLSPLTLAHPGEYEGAAALPGWLADVPFTRQEAAAVVAFQSAYRLDSVVRSAGSSTTYAGHKAGVLEYLAATVVSGAANEDHKRRASHGN